MPESSRSHRASAIIVSNQGVKQLVGVPTTFDLPRDIKRAVGDVEVDVHGQRHQNRHRLLISLGANMAFVGPPVLLGLAWQGQGGVERTLELLCQEIHTDMAWSVRASSPEKPYHGAEVGPLRRMDGRQEK